MVDTPISGLPTATSAADADLVVLVQGGSTKRGTVGHLRAGLATTTALSTGLAGKADTGHTHVAGDVSGLGTAATRDVGTTAGTVAAGDDTRLSDARTPTAHGHTAGDVSGLAPVATSGAYGDLTGRPTLGTAAATDATAYATAAQGAKADAAVQSVNGQTGAVTLAAADVGAAPTSHGHAIADVTGLQTALDGKAPASHTHTASQISDSTATGRAVLTAADAASARTAIGAAADTELRRWNHIVNGGFDVWQRGTSVTAPAGTATYVADRWQVFQSGAAVTAARTTFVPGQTDVPGEPAFYMSLTIGAGTAFFAIQKVEDVRTLAGRPVAVTGYVRADVAGRTIDVVLRQNFGIGGSATVATTAGTIITTTAWQRFTFTVTLPPVGGKTIGTGSSLGVSFENLSAADLLLDLAAVSLVDGHTAAEYPQVFRPVGQELPLCRRYFRRYATQRNTADLAFEMRATPAESGTGPYDYNAEL